jgi:hypothetical protein
MIPITVAPVVIRKLKRERAIEILGRRWLLHPANRVRRLPQPIEYFPSVGDYKPSNRG